MKITKTRLNQLIKEELALYEVELAPATYQKLKAAGKLPPGAKIDFKLGQGKQAAPEAQAQQQPKAEKAKSNFDKASGKPQTKKGERLCAQNPECYGEHLEDMISKNKFSLTTGQPTGPLKQIYLNVVKKAVASGDTSKIKGAAQAKAQKAQAGADSMKDKLALSQKSMKDKLALSQKAGKADDFIRKQIMNTFEKAMSTGDRAAMQQAQKLMAQVKELRKQDNFAKILQIAKSGGWKETA